MVRVALAAAAAAVVVGVSATPNAVVYGRAVNSTSSTSAPASRTSSASSTSASIPISGTVSSATTATTTTAVTSSSVLNATTSAAATSASGTITPVPTGVLPDDYFVKGNTPRTWSQALALAAKFVAPMTVEEKGKYFGYIPI